MVEYDKKFIQAITSAAESALRSVAIGLLMNLDARFYATFGRPFLEVLIADPATAYREALKVAPQGLVEAAIKIALRAFGLGPHDVTAALDGMRKGDNGPLSEALRRLASGGD
ncbi:MAG: hypothetical protein ACP5HK_07445 [Acidilobus sp.]